jgi:DNA-binding GntR family transcriptional regulator
MADQSASVYDQIRRRVLEGDERALSEYTLARDLEVSRTPIREALKRLEREELVVSVPRRGTFVRELTVQDVIEIYQVRTPLEVFAAGVAAERMNDSQIEGLIAGLTHARDAATSGDDAEAFTSDISFHQMIIGTTRNRRLATILAGLDDQVHRIRAIAFRAGERLDSALAEHGRVLESIASRNARGAEAAMAEHLHHAREHALRLLVPAAE